MTQVWSGARNKRHRVLVTTPLGDRDRGAQVWSGARNKRHHVLVTNPVGDRDRGAQVWSGARNKRHRVLATTPLGDRDRGAQVWSGARNKRLDEGSVNEETTRNFPKDARSSPATPNPNVVVCSVCFPYPAGFLLPREAGGFNSLLL
jgi:hypothetical protein